jgi:orotate phosphoribosyltransferase
MIADELAEALREHALLEGDFVLRSGRRSRYYLDKYRFATRPELLRPLGERLAEEVRTAEPDATLLAAPELGAVALAAAASLASNLPFVIVRREAKTYGTGNRIEGVFSAGERAALIEDVVTSGGAALDARRAASTLSRGAPSVYGRYFGPASCSNGRKVPQTRMVEPKAVAW